MKESNKKDKKLIDTIIKVAYGDAGIIDRIYIHFKAATNEKVKFLLEECKSTANVVHNLKQENVPEYMTEKIKSYTGGLNKKESILSSFPHSVYSFFGKKAIPATVLGILIVFIISFLILREPAPSHKYSNAEIELAEKQFRQSMVIVGEAFQNAENSFSNEVLNKQVNKNLNRGYYLVNNILTGG